MWVHSRCGLQVCVGPPRAFGGRLRNGRLPRRPASLATWLNRQLPELDSHQQVTGPPRRTLPHPASRHRSPQGMRSPRPCSPAETVDPQPVGPRPGVVALPVPAVASVLDAGKDRQALLDVAVELGELPPRVAAAEIRAPTP